MPDLNSATLPLTGWHLIEASAGTGKTYNIARIFIRLVLEKRLTVDKILVMTFTRAATQELRGRISELIREALTDWDDLDEPFFESLRLSIDKNEAMVLLENALLSMDEAAIYTIHGFCKRALTQQAFASRISFNAVMETDSNALALEAVRDWYRVKATGSDYNVLYGFWSTPEQFSSAFLQTITSTEALHLPEKPDLPKVLQEFSNAWDASEAENFHKLNVAKRRTPKTIEEWQNCWDMLALIASGELAIDDPAVHFNAGFIKAAFGTKAKQEALPATSDLFTAWNQLQLAKRAGLVAEGVEFARRHLNQSKQMLVQLDFNDLISSLKNSLLHDDGAELAELLLEQFPAALVDEFQDTDPDQFSILDTIYRKKDSNEEQPFLCLIGDPKQAIYGFRGGDVFAYLSAREKADHTWEMNTNYRSAQAVISGYNRLFYGTSLSSDKGVSLFGFGIEYLPVNAGRTDIADIGDSTHPHATQWIDFEAAADGNLKLNAEFRQEIACWTADEILRLFTNGSVDGQNISPGDIAVLVRSGVEASIIHQAFTHQGINAVYLSARDNVFKSQEASELLRVLRGILELENSRLLFAALSTFWFGQGTDDLYELRQDDFKWVDWQLEFNELRELWRSSGLMTMALKILHKYFIVSSDNNERQLTNTLHLLELLQQASQTHRQPWALVNWLEHTIYDDASSAESELRLESDANLVKIVTMHGSKGLEYPIVFLPFISYGSSKANEVKPVERFHERDNHKAVLAVAPDDEIHALWLEEQQAESRRLLYVAATRAKLRLIAAVAPFSGIEHSPLAQCMPTATSFPEIKAELARFELEEVAAIRQATFAEGLADNPRQLSNAAVPEPAIFSGFIERDWWLSSFSSLSRNVRHGGSSVRDRDQETDLPEIPTAELPLRFRLAKGAEAGNLLHDTLENLDFNQPDFETAWAVPQQRYAALFDSFKTAELQKWLVEILETKLTDSLSLSQLNKSSTLRESEFYFPMNALDYSALSRLSAIVADHLGRPYEIPGRHPLKGMMHGFIDLVFEHQGKYYVADYKSTWLGNRLVDYSQKNMEHSMVHSYYDLQYLIYALALHRYLQTRIADYDPQAHFGGAYYLYLRGMSPGADTGVYFRNISPDTLSRLDELFTGDKLGDVA